MISSKAAKFSAAFEKAGATGDPQPLYNIRTALAFVERANRELDEWRKNPPRTGNPGVVETERERAIEKLTHEIVAAVRRTHTAAVGHRDVAMEACAEPRRCGEEASHAAELAKLLDDLVGNDDTYVLQAAADLCDSMTARQRDAGDVVARELQRRGYPEAARQLEASMFDSRFAYKRDPRYINAVDTLKRCDEWLQAHESEPDVLLEFVFDGKTYSARASELIG